jgi:hypothetical protein
MYLRYFFALAFLLVPSLALSQQSTNLILIPDLQFGAHQFGMEWMVSESSKVGFLAAYKNNSDRPTYGETNGNVENSFRRVMLPWVYSSNGVWNNGYVIMGLIGLENSQFQTEFGSRVEVTFLNLGLLAGYQWFFAHGLNVSAVAGGALLVKGTSDENRKPGESLEVNDYLDKNTKTNFHPGLGVILGWSF